MNAVWRQRMRQAIWRKLAIASVLGCLCLPTVALAEVSAGGSVGLWTDYVFRGVSQTMSRPAVQAQFDIESDNGWYGYVWGANVDFLDSSEPDDGVDFEVDVGLGYAFALPGSSYLSLEVVKYLYPAANDGVDYDYEEFIATLSIAERHGVSVGYTDDVFGSDATGVFYALRSGFQLADNYQVGVEAGHYRLAGPLDTNYSYAELSMDGSLESVDWRVSYIATTNVGEELFYSTTTDDRFVLGFSVEF